MSFHAINYKGSECRLTGPDMDFCFDLGEINPVLSPLTPGAFAEVLPTELVPLLSHVLCG